MRNALRIALTAAIFAALTLAGTSTARGQVFFQGNFPLPHGRISVGVGAPAFGVGAYVPAPYADQIYYRQDYGYGFSCDQGWVPVQRYGNRWIVIERPSGYGSRSYGQYDRRYDRYDRRYDNRFDRRYDNRYGRYDNRRNNRNDRDNRRYDRDDRGHRGGDWR